MAILRHLLASLLINTLIAAFLTAIGVGRGFAENLVFSQCIGLTIYGACLLVLRFTVHGRRRLIGILLAVPGGSALGVTLALMATGAGAPGWLSATAYQALVIGLLFGTALSYLFYARERMTQLEAELKERELRQALAEQGRVGAQLRMLQAQIEPHFLFNTLANLSALIRSDPPRAERMLEDLIRYLRAALARTRAEGATLADEIELLRAYLDILGLRMGGRLRYAFEVPPELLPRAFPPMLLQPLVENSVKHGLEPKVEGGELRLAATLEAGRLRIAVEDTGVGLRDASGRGGIGLDNVRQRLKALYGEAARLEVGSNGAGGVTAILELPA